MSVWLQPASADEWWAVERPHRDRKRAWGLNVTAILTPHIRSSFIAMKANYIVFARLALRQILQLARCFTRKKFTARMTDLKIYVINNCTLFKPHRDREKVNYTWNAQMNLEIKIRKIRVRENLDTGISTAHNGQHSLLEVIDSLESGSGEITREA